MINIFFIKNGFGRALHVIPQTLNDVLILKDVYPEIVENDNSISVHDNFIMHRWKIQFIKEYVDWKFSNVF